jgi:stage IV sporulation protein FA
MAGRSSIKRRRRERIRQLREMFRERLAPNGASREGEGDRQPDAHEPRGANHPQANHAQAGHRQAEHRQLAPRFGLYGNDAPGYGPDPAFYRNDPEEFWKERQKAWERQYREARESEAMWGGLWSLSLFRYKLLASLVLFALVWGMFALDHPRTEPAQRFIEQALTESIDFQAVEAWYYRHFDGFPAFIPAFRGQEPAEKAAARQPAAYYQPTQGKIVTPFSEQHPGVLLETAVRAPVVSLDAGRVIFAGHTNETGWTVIVQHGGGITAYYGLLQDIQRSANDWVKGGDLIGYASGDERMAYGQVYLALKRDDRFIDPSEALNLP